MSTERFGRSAEILLVEDNPGDVRLIREALLEAAVPSNLSVARDGVEAMAFLRREGPLAQAVLPDFIVLDLNLPRKDGREVLREIKSDPHLRRIPVIVLTTSSSSRDVLESYDFHANCFITKPTDLEQFFRTVQAINEFWSGVVTPPSIAAPGR